MLPIVIKISTFWVKKVATTAVIFLRPILLDKVKSFKEVKNWTDKFFPIYHIGFSRVKIRLGMNLVWGSVLEDQPRFRRFKVQNFQVCCNIKWKIYPFFDILCSKNLWFSLRFSLFWEVRRFEVQFQRMNLGSEGSRFNFLKVWEVRDSVFSCLFQV